MKAQDLMTRKVHTADLTTPVRKLVDLMVSHKISAVPVVDAQRRVLGIVSEGDLLRRAEIGTERRRAWWSRLINDPRDDARDYVKSRGSKARDVMTRPVISVSATTGAADIADLMEKWRIKRVPVVRAGKLIGIVSRRDLMRAIGATQSADTKASVHDKALRESLRKQIAKEDWVDSALVNFIVDKGRVEIFGVVPSLAQADAVRVMAEGIKGARAVKNNLSVVARRAYVT